MNYKMLVEIPITAVPNDIPIQSAKVSSELWLKIKVPDAKLISFTSAEERSEGWLELGQSLPLD